MNFEFKNYKNKNILNFQMTDIGRKMSETREGTLQDQGDHIEIPQVAHKDDQSLPPRFDQMQIQEDSAIEDQSQEIANNSSHPQLAGRTSSTSQQRFAVHSLTNLRSDTNSKGQMGVTTYPEATQDLVVTNMMMDNSITLQQVRQESGSNSEMLNTNLYCQQMATVLRSSKQQSGVGSKLEQHHGIKVQDFPRIEDFDGGKFKRTCCNFPNQHGFSNDQDAFSKAESLNHSFVKFDQSFKPQKGKKKNKGPEGFQHRQFFSNVAGNNKSTALRKYKSTHPGLYCLTPPKELDEEIKQHEDTLAELNQLENGDITGNSLVNTLATRKIVSTNRNKQPTRSGLSKTKKPQSGKRKKNTTTNMSLGAKRAPLSQKQIQRNNKTSTSGIGLHAPIPPVHAIREIQENDDSGTVEKTKEDMKSSDRVLEFDVQAAYKEYQIKEVEDEKNEVYKYKLDRSYNISRAIEGELSPSHQEKMKKAEQTKKVNFAQGQNQFVGIKQREASLVRSSSVRAKGTIGIANFGSRQDHFKNGGRRMTGRAIWGQSHSLSNVHGMSSGGIYSRTTEIAVQHKKLIASHSKNKSQRQILMSNTNALIQGLNDISHSLLDNNLSRSPQHKKSDNQPIPATLYASGKRSASNKKTSKQHSRDISNRIANSLYQTDELINGPSNQKLIQEVQNPNLIKVNENNSEQRTISQDFQSTLKRGPGSPESPHGTFKYPKSASGKAVISLIPLQKHTGAYGNQTGLDGTQRLMRDSCAIDQLNEHDKIIIDEGLQASREAVDRHLNSDQFNEQHYGEANASYNDISMHGQVSVMEPIRKTAHHSGGKNQSSTPSITPIDGEADGEFEIPQSPKTRPTARYEVIPQDSNTKSIFKTENVTHTFEYKINLAGRPDDGKTRNVQMPDTQFKSEQREYDESLDRESAEDSKQSGVYEPIKSKQEEIKPLLSNKSKVSGIHKSALLSPQNDSKSGNRYKRVVKRNNDKNTDSGTEIPIPDRDDFDTPSLNHNVYENSEQAAPHSTGSPQTREKVLIKNQNMTNQYGTLIEPKEVDIERRKQSYAEQYKKGTFLANTAGNETLKGLLNRTMEMNNSQQQKTINVSRPGTATQLDKNQIRQINSKYGTGGSYQNKRSFTKSPDVNSPGLNKFMSGNQLAIVPNIMPDSRLARSMHRVGSSCKNDEFSVAEMSAQVMLDQNEGVTEGSQGLNLIPTGFYIQSPSGNFNIPNFAADKNDVIYEHARGESKDSGFDNLDLEQVFREAIAQHEQNTNKLIDQTTKMNILKFISLHQDAILREQVDYQTIPQLRYNQRHLVEGPQANEKKNYRAFRRQDENDIYLRHRQNDKLFHLNKHDFMIQGKKLISIKQNLRQQQIFQYLQKQIAIAQLQGNAKQMEQEIAQANEQNKMGQKKTSVEVNINTNLIEKFQKHLMPSISSGANIHSEQMIHSTRRTVTLNPKQSLQQSITGRQGKIQQVYSSINTTHNRGLNAISGAGVPNQLSPKNKIESHMKRFQASLMSSAQATLHNVGSQQKQKNFNLGSSSDSKGQLSPSSNSLGGHQNTTQLIQMTTEGRVDETTINAMNPNLQLLAEQSLESARRMKHMPVDANGNPFLNADQNYPNTIDQQSAFAKQMTSSAVSNSGHYGMAGEGVLQSPRMQHDLRASTAYSGKDGPLKITDGANLYNHIRNSQESQVQHSGGFVDQSKTEINDVRNSGENVEFIREYHGPQDLYQPPSDRGKQLYSATPDLPETFSVRGKDQYLYIQGKRQSAQELTSRAVDIKANDHGTQPIVMNIDNQGYNINKQEFFQNSNDTPQLIEESQTANRTINQTTFMQQDVNPYLNQNQMMGDIILNSDRQQKDAHTVSGEQVLPIAFHTLTVKKDDVKLKFQEDHKSPATLDMNKRIPTSNMKASESNGTKKHTINESEPNISSYHITKPKLQGETTSMLDDIIGQTQAKMKQQEIVYQVAQHSQNLDQTGTFVDTQFVSANQTPNNLTLIKPTHLERKKLLSNLSNETQLIQTDKSGRRQVENNSETVDVKSMFHPRSLRAKIDLNGARQKRNDINQKVALSSSEEQIVIQKSKSKLMSKIGKSFVNDKFNSMAQTVSDRMREGNGIKQATLVRPRSSQIEKGGSTPHTASITVSVMRQIPSDNNQDLLVSAKENSETQIKTSQTFRIGSSDVNRTFSRNPDMQTKGIQSASQFENQPQVNTLQNSLSQDRVSTFIKNQHLEKIQKGEVWLKGSTVKTNSDLHEIESIKQVQKMNLMDQMNDQAEIDEKDETIVDEALEQIRQERESEIGTETVGEKMMIRLNSQSQKASIENLPEIQEVSGTIHLHKSKTIVRNVIFDEPKTQANMNLLKSSKLCNRLNKGPGGEAANLIGSIQDAKSKNKSRSSKMIPSHSQAMYVIKKPSENDQSASRLIENSKVLQDKAKIVKGKRINSAIQKGVLRSSYQYDAEQEKGVICGGGRVPQPLGLVTKKPESIRTGEISAYDCCTGLKSGAISSKTNKMRRLRSAGRATGIGSNENTSAVKESQNNAISQDPSNYWAGATINNQIIDVIEDELITSEQDYFSNRIRPGTAKVTGFANGPQGRFSSQNDKKISHRNIQKQRIESAHHPIQTSYNQGLYNSTGFVDNTSSLKILQQQSPKNNNIQADQMGQAQQLQNQGFETGLKTTQYGAVRIMSRAKMGASKTTSHTFGGKEGFGSIDQMSAPGTEKIMAQTTTNMKNQDLLYSGLPNKSSNKAPIWMLNANRNASSVNQVQQNPVGSRMSKNHQTQISIAERNSSNHRFSGPSYFYKTNAESVIPSVHVQNQLMNGDLSVGQQFYQSETQISQYSQMPSQISRPSISQQKQVPKRRGGSLSQTASMNNYNIMRARRRLQKGTTFKDQDFEARRKDGSRGLVI